MISKTDEWPAFRVERRAVAGLKPYKGNARTHSAEQVEQIAASIREWGWTQPILVDERGGVIAGHGRLEAAKVLGAEEVPVIVAKGWSKAQKRAYVLADNQIGLNSGWDADLLRVEIGAIRDSGFDVGLTGFGATHLADLFAKRTGGLVEPDDAPAVEVVPVTVPGDLWLCGTHRVLCGDSTNSEAVARLLAGAKPHLMVTDPPYGVEYSADWRNNSFGVQGRSVGRVHNDACADWRQAYDLFPGEVTYAWSADLRSREAIEGLEASGFEIRAQIIWAKQQFAVGRGHYHFQHEPCWYAVRKGKTGHWTGDRKQTTLWQIDKPKKSETGHSTQKPVECMRRPIVNNSQPGDAVYDPFLGSGTTMIAAEMEGRACYGLELSPAYCDVIVKRWQAFTGNAATLDGDGRTFEEISHERRPEFTEAAE